MAVSEYFFDHRGMGKNSVPGRADKILAARYPEYAEKAKEEPKQDKPKTQETWNTKSGITSRVSTSLLKRKRETNMPANEIVLCDGCDKVKPRTEAKYRKVKRHEETVFICLCKECYERIAGNEYNT